VLSLLLYPPHLTPYLYFCSASNQLWPTTANDLFNKVAFVAGRVLLLGIGGGRVHRLIADGALWPGIGSGRVYRLIVAGGALWLGIDGGGGIGRSLRGLIIGASTSSTTVCSDSSFSRSPAASTRSTGTYPYCCVMSAAVCFFLVAVWARSTAITPPKGSPSCCCGMSAAVCFSIF
jgi:hypothetical protein